MYYNVFSKVINMDKSKNMREKRMKTAAFHTLGCKVNAYETDAMEQILIARGYKIVSFEDVADVYIINTCSVTNIADRKSRQMIHRARKQNPHAIVAAAGCYVQAAPEDVLKDAGVDVIIGNNRKKEIADILDAYLAQQETCFVLDIGQEKECESLSIAQVSGQEELGHTRAYLKIQDGCNQFCSYCIIPYVRGRVRSRSVADVVEEAAALAASGIREVVLTGIHISSYGLDWKEEGMEQGEALLTLLRAIHDIPGIARIRLGSLEPRIVTDAFARALSELPKLCPHFHLSLQSGCDATLRRMNRKYNTEEYRTGCEILRKYFSCPAITTDVIAGFPGETEEEFAQTMDFVREIGFYEMHVFKYSRRKGTVADKMEQQISEEIKTRRSKELIALGAEMSESYRKGFLGSTQTVLLEEPVEIQGETYMSGYLPEYIRVAVKTDAPANALITGTLTEMLTKDCMLLQPETAESGK